MPELPEVETVVRYLKHQITGKTVSKLLHKNSYSKVFSSHSPENIFQFVKGQKVLQVWRRGKYIVFTLDFGYLFFHLRMTGRFILKLGDKDLYKHITAELIFSDQSSLYFKDYRKFGRIGYCHNIIYINCLVGVEPLGSMFSLQFFQSLLKKRKRQIKPLLLDQSFISGLGNIYVDESLWYACIHPQTLSNQISRGEIKALYFSILSVLREAIKLKGTTIITFKYGENSRGTYTEFLKVYGRRGEPCFRCNGKIKKAFIGQRGSYFCSNCQRRSKTQKSNIPSFYSACL